MTELLVHQQTELSPTVQAELEAFVGRKILAPARQIGYDLPVLGVTASVPDGPVYRKTPTGTWAFATDYREDPAADRYGGVSPVPQAILESLWEMRSAGVKPNELKIIHEVPATWEPGRPLPDLAPPSKRVRRHDELVVGAARQMCRGLAVAGVALGALAVAPAALLAVSAAAVAAPATGAISVVGLDPVILAGVRHPAGPCAWVPLASWHWE